MLHVHEVMVQCMGYGRCIRLGTGHSKSGLNVAIRLGDHFSVIYPTSQI